MTAQGGRVTAKRVKDQETIFRQYGRSIAGNPVPQMVVARGGIALREVSYLAKRLRGELELRPTDRERIAKAIENGLAGQTFEQAFGLARPAHRPQVKRTFFQAAEYLLRQELGEKPASAVLTTVADRWSVSEGSVRAAVTKNRQIVDEWITTKVADHKRTYSSIGPQVSDRDTALRTLILQVDREIGPDDALYLAAVAK